MFRQISRRPTARRAKPARQRARVPVMRRTLLTACTAGALLGVTGCGLGSGGGPDWATLCAEVDVQALKDAASQLSQAEASVSQSTSQAEIDSSMAAVLRSGSTFLGTMSQELEPLYQAAYEESGEQSLLEFTAQMQSQSEAFAQLATEVETSGFNEQTVAQLDALAAQNEALGAGGDLAALESQLEGVPECVQLDAELDQIDLSDPTR